jgi:manganese transport protein
VIGAGVSPTRALVLSQVFLSFGIAFALVPLVCFTRSSRVMGPLANRRVSNLCTYLGGGLIIALNLYLLA